MKRTPNETIYNSDNTWTIICCNGEKVTIDDSDKHIINGKRIYVDRGYAGMKIGGKRKALHAIIMPPGEGLVTDHINGDKMDNRKTNLRICTRADNRHNSKIHKNNTTGCPGITIIRDSGKYVATITRFKIRHYLGGFDSKDEAIKAYRDKEKELNNGFIRNR